MLSRVGSSFYRTAAWRLALRSTLVFAAGSAAVFLAMYFIVARTVRERSDSWLTGESETLRQVALNTPRDALYDRIVEEVAELASQEVSWDGGGRHVEGNTVFFAQTGDPSHPPVWVGPHDSAKFLDALRGMNIPQGSPVSLRVSGWREPFRVVALDMRPGDGRLYLGLLDSGAAPAPSAPSALLPRLGLHGRLRLPPHPARPAAHAQARRRHHRRCRQHPL